jgi:hypothetical protein
MRRGTELAVTHMSSDKPEYQQANGGLLALFGITVILLAVAFWSVSNAVFYM